MINFEVELQALIDTWAPRTSRDDLMSALELALYALKEQGDDDED